jgi:hypothetical protein
MQDKDSNQTSDMTVLETNILATIEYFDLLDKPLTAAEVYFWLLSYDGDTSRVSFYEVKRALEDDDRLAEYIDRKHGVFFLQGREHLVEVRQARTRISGQRFRRVRRFARLLQSAPFVKSLFLAGSVSISNSKDSSDIDFFVVTSRHRIWTARFFLTLLTHVRGIRRHGSKEANRMCLNHYVSEENLHRADQDVYAAHLYGTLIPLTSEDATLEEFHQANTWITRFYPHLKRQDHQFFRETKPQPIRRWGERWFSGPVGDAFEHALGSLQQAKIQQNPPSRPEKARVGVSDLELEFHPLPHGPRISQQLEERLHKMSAR